MLFPCLVLLASAGLAASPVHHELVVRLDLDRHEVRATDRLTLDPTVPHPFTLHAGLTPRVKGRGWTLLPDASPPEAEETAVPVTAWRLVPSARATSSVTVSWKGTLHHPLAGPAADYQRGFSETPGFISQEAVYLARESVWVPTFGDGLVTYDLTVEGLVPPWNVVSAGTGSVEEKDGHRVARWSSADPQEEIYLVAGPWEETWEEAGGVMTGALLRTPDPTLAWRYLQATRRYLALYESFLPPFPYRSFALVENAWETGYGMPGFTLLGSEVLRFPWILSSSYPHELLHNWWGNSVYVPSDAGNWSEGLTTLLADHLFAEQRGEGAEYRRDALRRFTDFVTPANDLTLAAFTERTDAATEAVGYGKAMMVLHMVRRAVGDEAFKAGLKRFAEAHRFQRATWTDLGAAFGKPDVEAMLATWVGRTGAPRIEIGEVQVEAPPRGGTDWRITVELRQVQAEDPFPLDIPLAVQVEGRAEAVMRSSGPCGRTCRVEATLPGRPQRLQVDPAYDVMRLLDPWEGEPTLSAVSGAPDPLFVLPAAATDEARAAWSTLAADLARPGAPRTVLDRDLTSLPEGPAWILGWENRFAPDLAADPPDLQAAARDRQGRAVVRVGRNGSSAAAFVATDAVATLPALGRKLPRYTKYGWLLFQGDTAENTGKGTFAASRSPLVRDLGGGPPVPLRLPPRSPLVEAPPLFDAASLAATIGWLSDPTARAGRKPGTPGMAEATAHVVERLGSMGLQPWLPDGFVQAWTGEPGSPGAGLPLQNVLARIPGTDPTLANEPVLVMAHLDHLGPGFPGADDNASGVAALLAVAGALATEPPRARSILVAFPTGEETGLLGSRHLLGSLGDVRPMACLSLDTVGHLTTAGRLLVLDAPSAREWRHIFLGAGYTTNARVEVATLPVEGSDQRACIEGGIPGVQLTTGPFAGYHKATDTADQVDAAGVSKAAEVALEALRYLADRREPLTVENAGGSSGPPASPGSAPVPRKVGLGTVPDFAFGGPGVRIQEVTAGSPAEAAGIRAGDVILALDATPIATLKDLAAALAPHTPGDRVAVRVSRDGQEQTIQATLQAR